MSWQKKHAEEHHPLSAPRKGSMKRYKVGGAAPSSGRKEKPVLHGILGKRELAWHAGMHKAVTGYKKVEPNDAYDYVTDLSIVAHQIVNSSGGHIPATDMKVVRAAVVKPYQIQHGATPPAAIKKAVAFHQLLDPSIKAPRKAMGAAAKRVAGGAKKSVAAKKKTAKGKRALKQGVRGGQYFLNDSGSRVYVPKGAGAAKKPEPRVGSMKPSGRKPSGKGSINQKKKKASRRTDGFNYKKSAWYD